MLYQITTFVHGGLKQELIDLDNCPPLLKRLMEIRRRKEYGRKHIAGDFATGIEKLQRLIDIDSPIKFVKVRIKRVRV